MIQVAVVDDSAVVQETFKQLLSQDPEINVLYTASDPIFALHKFEKQWPDVIITDIEMPRMDGISFIREIKKIRDTPIIVCSSVTGDLPRSTIAALEAGAVEIIPKPQLAVKQFLQDIEHKVVHLIKAAYAARKSTTYGTRQVQAESASDSPVTQKSAPTTGGDFDALFDDPRSKLPCRLVAIGASTGGVQALESIITALRPPLPPIVIVQHMPEKFTEAFAQRLDHISVLHVREARDSENLKNSTVYIAPGNFHMEVRPDAAGFACKISQTPPVNRHRPSVDVLFRSVARHVGKLSAGILLTGMGADGAEGLLEMRKAGSRTCCQDQASSIVFGMPYEGIRLGAAQTVISLDRMPQYIASLVHR
ncbi:MAG: chemotaxis response regulator protein-glutamate methylesterase [Spirochaetaceae bacterium]|nr:chemotaxis response regulator protein-glutamate methylesterase [Spirochaetaceae bacterium]|tara:strand:+ start:272412 stop:273506 length:1095 start_codon:yes stop_codon:yes gene_type:complete